VGQAEGLEGYINPEVERFLKAGGPVFIQYEVHSLVIAAVLWHKTDFLLPSLLMCLNYADFLAS
jgi:hypothetical protein